MVYKDPFEGIAYWECYVCGEKYDHSPIIWTHPICFKLECGGILVPKHEYEVIE